MYTRTPDDFNNLPLWDSMPNMRACPMMDDMSNELDENRQVQFPTSTGGDQFIPGQSNMVQNDIGYTQGWLKTQIGKYIKIEFLIGTNMLIDREGVLKEVGISYVVIRESGTNDLLMCDIYSIKFVRIFHDQAKAINC